jgi:diguanylate cyclase (GGDEF)-like protein/PAS domain S-box-containing protein
MEASDVTLGSYLEQYDMQDVLARMPVAVAWATYDGRIRFVNRKFHRMFGYTLDDLTTVQDWIKKCYAIADQVTIIDNFWQTQRSPSSKPAEIEDVELEIVCKDGSSKSVLGGRIVLPNLGGAISTYQDITPRKENERIIRKQAMEDQLTGLLNRRAFSHSMELAMRSCRDGSDMALMMVDLDGFKRVNDTLGHDCGDLLLMQVTERLKLAVREQDVLCRIGGDEFCVVVNRINNEETAKVIADRILFSLAQPYTLNGREVSIGASIGIAMYPEDGRSEKELFKYADEALYRAKQDGKGRWRR